MLIRDEALMACRYQCQNWRHKTMHCSEALGQQHGRTLKHGMVTFDPGHSAGSASVRADWMAVWHIVPAGGV